MSGEADIDVSPGLDVGKGDHHATAVNRAGKMVFDEQLRSALRALKAAWPEG